MPIFKKQAEPKKPSSAKATEDKKEEAKAKKPAAKAEKPVVKVEKPATKAVKKPVVSKKETAVSASAKAPVDKPVRATGDAWRILVRPIVTERYSGQGKDYAFEVNPKANKLEIRKALKDAFGVTALSVRVMNVLGKAVRTNSGYSHRANWRKAIVSLKKGESLDLFAKNA
jgi:large subunit ribosomal protein L23